MKLSTLDNVTQLHFLKCFKKKELVMFCMALKDKGYKFETPIYRMKKSHLAFALVNTDLDIVVGVDYGGLIFWPSKERK